MAQEISSATITLDIYSGRPNPSWTLDTMLLAELERRVAELKPAEEKPETPGLGYRGMQVVLRYKNATETDLTAVQGYVTEAAGTTFKVYADPDRSFEKWLFVTGKIPREALKAVPAEIQASQ